MFGDSAVIEHLKTQLPVYAPTDSYLPILGNALKMERQGLREL